MTIGIAIPVHYKYIPYLEPLLDSISNSTTPPTEVSVSISDCPDNFNLKEYPFKLILTKTKNKKNPCENRNIAANALSTDIISFIDSDDLSFSNRNEFLLKSFMNGSNVVVHNYEITKNRDIQISSTQEDLEIFHEYIDTVRGNIPFPFNKDFHQDYHMSQ